MQARNFVREFVRPYDQNSHGLVNTDPCSIISRKDDVAYMDNYDWSHRWVQYIHICKDTIRQLYVGYVDGLIRKQTDSSCTGYEGLCVNPTMLLSQEAPIWMFLTSNCFMQLEVQSFLQYQKRLIFFQHANDQGEESVLYNYARTSTS